MLFRSLSSAREQIRLRDEIVKNSWSVRLTEEGVKRKQPGPRRHIGRRPADLIAAEESLRRRLATRVRLVGSETRGRIEISYVSRDELERLLEQLGGRP